MKANDKTRITAAEMRVVRTTAIGAIIREMMLY
jgi:hypothetical protein